MSDDTTKETHELDKALGILKPLIDNNTSEEDMVIALIKNGYKFAKAGRLLAKVLEHSGQRLSAKDRYTAVSELLAQGFEPKTWGDLEETVKSLLEEVKPSTEGQIFSCIKRYAKDHKIELPNKPALRLANDFNARFEDWALANRNATPDELRAFVIGCNAKENQVDKYVARFGFVLDFARKFAAQ